MFVALARRTGKASGAPPRPAGWHGRIACALLLAWFAACAAGQTLRVANQGEVLSLDPHAQNEGLQLDVLYNVYEPLVGRNAHYQLAPALATRWERSTPTVWRFALRQGVRFHDGSPFTAADVVFSLRRAQLPGSAMRVLVSHIAEVRAAGENAVEIETRQPDAILPQALFRIYIMSRRWCETHQALAPANRLRGQENAASFAAYGTGPFRLAQRLVLSPV